MLLNRPNVIAGELKRYAAFRTQLEDLLTNLRNPSVHPFVSEVLLEATVKHFTLLGRELRDREEVLERTFVDDPVRDRLADILATRIGSYVNGTLREEIRKYRARSVQSEDPPGYKDNDKLEDERFGDLVI